MNAEMELGTNKKAFQINLDPTKYGTFAEIGAGQEVARRFFQAGGASGTVAKTMSAYDMQFSDAIYGPADRYVSRARLGTMLDHEYDLLIERLARSFGITIVLVTHELGSVHGIADRCILLDKESKSILAEGTPDELAASTNSETTDATRLGAVFEIEIVVAPFLEAGVERVSEG